jgi:hypothetical protein
MSLPRYGSGRAAHYTNVERSDWVRFVELMIFVSGLCVLAVLALRFGHDSRPPAHSKELDLANLGLSSPSFHQPGEHTIPDMRHDTCRGRCHSHHLSHETTS